VSPAVLQATTAPEHVLVVMLLLLQLLLINREAHRLI
jgi:hypothetical protein